MINNAQNGFSLNSPKFVINNKIMLFYLKFQLQNDIYAPAFVEVEVDRVGVESDAKGGIQEGTSCLNNCSCLRVARASFVVAMVW